MRETIDFNHLYKKAYCSLLKVLPNRGLISRSYCPLDDAL